MELIEITLEDARALTRLLTHAVADVTEAETSRSLNPRAVVYIPGDSVHKIAVTGARRASLPDNGRPIWT